MTITSTQNRVSYSGNGSTTAFSVPFRFLASADLAVLVRVDATGVNTTKTLDTHYSVSGEGAATGGTVTFLIEDGEPQTGETLIIYGNPAMTQLVDYIAGGVFPAESHEEALDRLTLQGTRSREITERSLSLTDSSTDGSGQYDANNNDIDDVGTLTASKVTGLVAPPVDPTDATNKNYVDATVTNTIGPIPTSDAYVTATGSVTSRQLADRWGEIKNVKDFGATGDGVTDDTAAIEAAHTAAVSAGHRMVYVPPGTYYIPTALQISEIIWVGDGVFTGQLRERVHSSIRQGRAILGEVMPKRHLRQFAQTDTPVVVIMGDSIATDTPGRTHDESGSLWGMIQRRMVQQNPDAEITFHNRAIAGATWLSAYPGTVLNSIGFASLPTWAGAGSSSWLTYVEPLLPDVLLFNYGMNDKQNFHTSSFRNVMTTVLGWTKVPDIIFITNMVPTRQTSDASIAPAIAQEGRDFVAGYVRTYAQYNDFGLLDVNRQYNIVREGFDPTISHLFRDQSALLTGTLPYTAPAGYECADFGFEITFATIAAGFWSGSGSGKMRIRSSGSPPDYFVAESFLEISDDGGFVKVGFWDEDNAPSTPTGEYKTVTSAVATPIAGATFTLTAFFRSGYATVKIDEATVYEGPIRRHGGQFLPTVYFTDAFAPSYSLHFFPGVYDACMPTLTNKEMWGVDFNTGGNQLNHPSSQGGAAVYGPIIANTDFRQPVITEKSTDSIGTNERRIGIGKKSPQGLLHITKGDPANADVPAASANHLVIEGATAAGSSYLTNNTGVARVLFGDENNSSIGGLSYEHTTDEFKITVGGAVVYSSSATRADTESIRFRAEDNTSSANSALRAMTFSLTSDTNLRIYVRGNDDVVRSANLTLS